MGFLRFVVVGVFSGGWGALESGLVFSADPPGSGWVTISAPVRGSSTTTRPVWGLLHDVVDVGGAGKLRPQPRAQHAFVRLKVGDEPLVPFGVRRRHGAGCWPRKETANALRGE